MKALYYSVGELATVIGVSERTIYRRPWDFPGYTRFGRIIRFHIKTFHRETSKTQQPEVDQVVLGGARHNLI